MTTCGPVAILVYVYVAFRPVLCDDRADSVDSEHGTSMLQLCGTIHGRYDGELREHPKDLDAPATIDIGSGNPLTTCELDGTWRKQSSLSEDPSDKIDSLPAHDNRATETLSSDEDHRGAVAGVAFGFLIVVVLFAWHQLRLVEVCASSGAVACDVAGVRECLQKSELATASVTRNSSVSEQGASDKASTETYPRNGGECPQSPAQASCLRGGWRGLARGVQQGMYERKDGTLIKLEERDPKAVIDGGGSESWQRDALELSRMQQAAQRVRVWKDEWVCQRCTKRSFIESLACRSCGKERDDSDRLVLYSEAWRTRRVPGCAAEVISAAPRRDGGFQHPFKAASQPLRLLHTETARPLSPQPEAGDTVESKAAISEPWHYEVCYKRWVDEPFDVHAIQKISKTMDEPLPRISMSDCMGAIVMATAVSIFGQSSLAMEVVFFVALAVTILLRHFGFASPFGSIFADQRAATTVDKLVLRAESNPSNALELYAELRALPAHTLANAVDQSKSTAELMYGALLSLVGRCQKPELAMELFDDMQRVGISPTLTLYESAMRRLAGLHCFKQALAVYERQKLDGLKSSRMMQGYLVNFAAEVGELDLAIQMFGKLFAEHVPTMREYMLALRVLSKRRDFNRSLALYRDCQARGAGVDGMMLNVTLATGVAAKMLDGAKALLQEAAETSPSIPDVISFNTVLKGCSQNCEANGHALIARMTELGISPNAITYNTAIDGAIRCTQRHGGWTGAASEAWRLVAAMRASGLQPDDFTCAILNKGISLFTVPQLSPLLDILEEVGRAVPRLDMALQSVCERAATMRARHNEDVSALVERAHLLMEKHYPERTFNVGQCP